VRWHVGLPMNKLFLFLAAGMVGFGAQARAVDLAQCMASNSKFIKTVDEQLESFGVKPNDPCPEQDLYDAQERKCSTNLDKLRDIDKELRAIMKEKCENAAEIEKLAAGNNGQQKDSQDGSSDVYKKGKNINDREFTKLGELKGQVKKMRAFYAEIAEGAKQIQQKVNERASGDPTGKDEHTDKLREAGSHRGEAPSNNQQAKSFFKDALGNVANLVSKARSSGISRSEAEQIKTPLTAEPLKIAAATTDWEKQIEARQKVVQSQGMLYQQNNATTTGRSSGLGDANKDSTGGQAASSSGSGSGSGGSDAAGSMGQAAQAMQAASGLAGAAGGGGASSSAADSGAGGYSSGAYDTGGSYSPGATAAETSTGGALSNTKGGQSSLKNKDGVGKIDNLESLVKTDGKTGTGITGSSSTKGSSLREALRERLNQSIGESQSGGGTTGASMAEGGGGGTGSSASSGAVTPDLLPASTSVASDNPLEASTGSVGGDLGNTDFSLAGSETDAAVKGMLKDFGVGEDLAGDRGPASEQQLAPEILASDSPSLFMRTRDVHQRSLKKGLVINGLRAKL
jgi:hypothetical protein